IVSADLLIQRPAVGCSPFVMEETPMTMQIVLRTENGGVVFASDTKTRTTEREYTNKTDIAFGIVNQPKIVISQKHHIAIALAGTESEHENPTQDLADYLSRAATRPESLSPLLLKWGNEYFQRKHPGETHDFPLFTLLVVDP